MIKKIRVEDLERGMFVTDLNTPWAEHPFVANRVVVRKAQDIDAMRLAGMEVVYIDTAKGKDSSKAVPLVEANRHIDEDVRRVAEGTPDSEPTPLVPFELEFQRARELYDDAKTVVKNQFAEVKQGGKVDGQAAESSVTDMISSIFQNRDAYLSLSRLKSFDEYTFHHSVNVAVLSLNLAVTLGILERELLRLGIGAILHDMGKVLIPDGLVQKRGPLDPKEFEVVKTHSLHGAKLLLDARGVPVDCAAVPLSHHERYDGSGYPRHVSGPGVGKFGLITAIADVYDAMTSDRPYQKGMPPTLALKKIYEWSGTHFHPLYVQRFIQCVGIYPVGTVVRLDTPQLGVVLRQNRGNLLRPWVRLVPTPTKAAPPYWEDVDLREPDPKREKPHTRSIERVVDPRMAGIDVDAVLWGSLPGREGARGLRMSA